MSLFYYALPEKDLEACLHFISLVCGSLIMINGGPDNKLARVIQQVISVSRLAFSVI